MTGDISSAEDLIEVREKVVQEWGRLDTLHIISGVPSTQTIYQATGLDMVPTISDRSTSSRSPSVATPARTHKFVTGGERDVSGDERSLPENDALKELEEEGMRLAAINMNGVVLSVGCFLPLLSSTSPSPLIHHLSSVAALVPAPTRMLYSATKTAGLAAFKTCAVECARDGGKGSGVRFLAVCPGTIDTGFREKSTSAMKKGGKKDPLADAQSEKVGKVLSVQDTVDSIIYHASLPPKSSPLVLYLPIPIPFLRDLLKIQLPFIKVPPKNIVVLPEWPYKMGWWVDATWLRGIVERMGRNKYGLV
ncbi:hypothetical protein FFLO_02111 [Filobasidium floriforme]|uniref:NAD(P)-binding protein n=1 Tax=Filobasidium floriforme TaxID=5210 RepID=A0A8K0JPG7_9TREE|nr:hypothetical protein FFLO_02111 [Filobasidium floriforme]